MIIAKASIKGFGKLKDIDIDMSGGINIIGFHKRIINLEAGFPGVLADCQVPFSRSAVAVTIISQCRFHTENGIGKQTAHRNDLTEIFRIDPLVIAIANLFHCPLVDQALQSPVLDLLPLQVFCAHYPAIAIKYFFVLFDIFHAKTPTQVLLLLHQRADKLMQFYYS